MQKKLSLPTRHPSPNSSDTQKQVSFVSEQGEQSPKICFKIVVIGESFVGKTALIQKFIKENFSLEYSVTVGVDFSTRSIRIEDTLIQLQIWDTCGHDIYRSVTSSFYRGACGVFLVFALNDRKSFEKLKFWFDQFQENGSPHALIILIGTKSDQEHDISTEEGLAMMKKMGGIFYVETSAETGEQIEELFMKTSELMYKKYKVSHDFRVVAEPRKHNSSVILDDCAEVEMQSKWARMRKGCC